LILEPISFMLHRIMRLVFRGFYLILGALGAFACNEAGLMALGAAPHCGEDFVLAYNQVALEGKPTEHLSQAFPNVRCQAIDRATGTVITLQIGQNQEPIELGCAEGIETIPTDKNVEVIPQDFGADEAGEV
jgi:hypothetical protein